MDKQKSSSTSRLSTASIASPALSRNTGYKSRQRESESVRSARNSVINLDIQLKSNIKLSSKSDLVKSKSNQNISEWKDSAQKTDQELKPVDQNNLLSSAHWNIEPGTKFLYSRSRASLQPKTESSPAQQKRLSSANPLLNPFFDIHEIRKEIEKRSINSLVGANEKAASPSNEILDPLPLSKKNSTSASSETITKSNLNKNCEKRPKGEEDVEKGIQTIITPNDCDSYFISAKTLTNLRFLFALTITSYLAYLIWKKRFELSNQLYAYNLLLTSLYFFLNFYKSLISNYQISTDFRIDRNFNLIFQIISSFSILLVLIYWMFVFTYGDFVHFSEDKLLDFVSYHVGLIVITFEIWFSQIDISKNKSFVIPVLIIVYEALMIALNYYLKWSFPFKFFDYYLNLSLNPFLFATNLIISMITSVVALMLVYYAIVVRNLVVKVT